MTGYEGLRETAAWIDLSMRGKIRVLGEDRVRLLHAMCTNDVQNLPPAQSLYAFFLNDKGHILADAQIYNFGESLMLDTEPETGEKLSHHLERYIIADDVTLEDETQQWAAIALEGPQSPETGGTLDIPVPDAQNALRNWQNGFVVRVASTGAEGLRIFVPASEKQALVDRFQNHQVPAASAFETRAVRLENGIPRYGEDIGERQLVQETQITRAVHYNKGCYLGQEIVERVRSRGQVHRLLTPIRIEAIAAPAAGTKVAVGGQEIGEITSAVYSPALNKSVGLAYLKREICEQKPEMLVAGSNPPVVAYIR